MAFPVKRIAHGDERAVMVEVMVASMFRHDGAYVRPGDRIMMTKGEADDLKALHFVRDVDVARPLGRGHGRGHVRVKA